MSKILITGGAGFIGMALARKLRSLNHNVIIIDLEEKLILIDDAFKSFAVDIRNYDNFRILDGLEFDYIYHLAAQTASLISQEEPELDVDTNVKGTLNICNFARKCKAKKIIFTSSMATYGNKEGKIKESDLQLPLSNYGVSKVAGEYYINMYRQFGIENTIFRLFNVYGPGQDMSNLRQGMASIFMTQSILSNEIRVTGSFDRYRDFIYVNDVIDALIIGLDDITNSEIYNVGSEEKTTVKELINLILEVNDKPKKYFNILNIGSHEGDQFGSKADSTKLKNLGWTPKTDLKFGLEKMYIYAKEALK